MKTIVCKLNCVDFMVIFHYEMQLMQCFNQFTVIEKGNKWKSYFSQYLV